MGREYISDLELFLANHLCYVWSWFIIWAVGPKLRHVWPRLVRLYFLVRIKWSFLLMYGLGWPYAAMHNFCACYSYLAKLIELKHLIIESYLHLFQCNYIVLPMYFDI